MSGDEITTGELGRRMDEVRDSVRELLAMFHDLDNTFIPRAELNERHRLIDLQMNALETAVAANRRDIASAKAEAVTALDTYKAGVATARRWAIGTAITGVLTVAALVVNVAFH